VILRICPPVDKLGLCRVCNNISDRELCRYCSDAGRDPAVVCVAEEPHGIAGIETTRQFEGRYHVLHGALSPLRGLSPDALKIRGLVERIGQGEIKDHGGPTEAQSRCRAWPHAPRLLEKQARGKGKTALQTAYRRRRRSSQE
jgi:hypothetical protein